MQMGFRVLGNAVLTLSKPSQDEFQFLWGDDFLIESYFTLLLFLSYSLPSFISFFFNAINH
jgi:hypothetical protein